MKKLSFLQNTIVLVASNLVTGSLNFLFSIILSREIGAQGMGLYQIVMPLYTLFLCITSGGVTTAISKIVAEENSKKNNRELFKSISSSMVFFSFWTLFVSILVVLMAPLLSVNVLKDSRVYISILVFVPALVFVSLSSVLKGYFYGLQNMTFPAVIDIIEKIIRIIVLITTVKLLKNQVLGNRIAGAVSAMTAGELVSLSLLYIFYKGSYLKVKQFTGRPDNVFQIIVNVLTISLPLCINGFLATIMGTFIAVMIPRRLQVSGFTAQTSLALYGKLTGMGMNIIMFPSIIIGAISTILVPAISEASTQKTGDSVNRKIYYSIKLTTAIAALSAGIFFSIPDELGRLFYSRTDLGSLIFSLSFGVIFIYIEATLFGILNGLGKQKILLRNTMIVSGIDVIMLYLLVGIPKINIYGYAINFVISPLVGCILNSLEIKKVTGIEIKACEIFIYPFIISCVESYIIRSLKNLVLTGSFNFTLSTIILIASGIISYCGIYYLAKTFIFDKKHFTS